MIADEPDQLLHVAHLLRDRRDRAATLAALIAELEAEGKTIVEDAGHDANVLLILRGSPRAPSKSLDVIPC